MKRKYNFGRKKSYRRAAGGNKKGMRLYTGIRIGDKIPVSQEEGEEFDNPISPYMHGRRRSARGYRRTPKGILHKTVKKGVKKNGRKVAAYKIVGMENKRRTIK